MSNSSLFISHSSDKATKLASFLHYEWIQLILNIQTWFSGDAKCLPKGLGFPSTIAQQAKDNGCNHCLVILTDANYDNHWINFEAGMFCGQDKKIHAILCGGLTHEKLASKGVPLSVLGMNYISPNKAGLKDFFITINNDLGIKSPEHIIEKQIDTHIDSFIEKYNSIFNPDDPDIDVSIAKFIKK